MTLLTAWPSLCSKWRLRTCTNITIKVALQRANLKVALSLLQGNGNLNTKTAFLLWGKSFLYTGNDFLHRKNASQWQKQFPLFGRTISLQGKQCFAIEIQFPCHYEKVFWTTHSMHTIQFILGIFIYRNWVKNSIKKDKTLHTIKNSSLLGKHLFHGKHCPY